MKSPVKSTEVEAIKLLKRIKKGSGLVIIIDTDHGDMITSVKDLCYHEIKQVLDEVYDLLKKDILETNHKETLEELDALKKEERNIN